MLTNAWLDMEARCYDHPVTCDTCTKRSARYSHSISPHVWNIWLDAAGVPVVMWAPHAGPWRMLLRGCCWQLQRTLRDPDRRWSSSFYGTIGDSLIQPYNSTPWARNSRHEGVRFRAFFTTVQICIIMYIKHTKRSYWATHSGINKVSPA